MGVGNDLLHRKLTQTQQSKQQWLRDAKTVRPPWHTFPWWLTPQQSVRCATDLTVCQPSSQQPDTDPELTVHPNTHLTTNLLQLLEFTEWASEVFEPPKIIQIVFIYIFFLTWKKMFKIQRITKNYSGTHCLELILFQHICFGFLQIYKKKFTHPMWDRVTICDSPEPSIQIASLIHGIIW